MQLLIYRVNRRPLAQMTLLAEQPTSFLDHLTEVLELQSTWETTGRGSSRLWRIGNRRLPEDLDYFAGRIGYETSDTQTREAYDEEEEAWVAQEEEAERVATAPFVIVVATRYLCVAKHPTFSEGTLPSVFEGMLNVGESRRAAATTEWAVEPILDEQDFRRWLERTPILEQVSFELRLPNPDAEKSFEQMTAHMHAQEAGELKHTLKPRDPERGLNRDFDEDPVSQGLMEAARRSFARIRAKGRSQVGSARSYVSSRRVRRESITLPPGEAEALAAVVQAGLDLPAPGTDSEGATSRALERGGGSRRARRAAIPPTTGG